MIRDLHDAIDTLLSTEATFVAAIQAIALASTSTQAIPVPETPGVLHGFRPFRSIGQEHYPTWVLEPGDDQSIEEAIGSCHQGFETEVLLALVWHQQDPELAYAQRLQLLDEVVRLFLRNPTPGGIADVRVDACGNDRQANHPTHVVTFRLLADVRINR